MTAVPEVLVVDDDENDRRLIVRELEDNWGPVRCVHDGAEALDLLHARGDLAQLPAPPPGLILLDLHMPRLNGWEVLRAIRADARLRTIPVVIFSSSDRASDVSQCYALGANAYVVKPVAAERFRDALRVIADFWLRYNQPAPLLAVPPAGEPAPA